jgi:hypothetical protein
MANIRSCHVGTVNVLSNQAGNITLLGVRLRCNCLLPTGVIFAGFIRRLLYQAEICVRVLVKFCTYIAEKVHPEECSGQGAEGKGGSASCVPRSRNCISCVPKCLPHVYQLRLELSTPKMTSCIPRLVRNCISYIERYGCTKCPTIGRFLHSFIVLYFVNNYMHTYRIVEWCRECTQFLYHVTI